MVMVMAKEKEIHIIGVMVMDTVMDMDIGDTVMDMDIGDTVMDMDIGDTVMDMDIGDTVMVMDIGAGNIYIIPIHTNTILNTITNTMIVSTTTINPPLFFSPK